jgi:tetraacyldisaccharide 4'-kinase
MESRSCPRVPFFSIIVKMAWLLRIYSPFSRLVCRIKSSPAGRKITPPKRASLPIISVGNLTLGGSEKTPLVIELIGFLSGLGFRPALVTRGYKGRWEKDGGILSDGRRLLGGWQEAGDEPLMIARRFLQAGVFVGKDRLSSCRKAKELGFDVVVLDDGFQHIKLARDLDIVLYDPRSRSALREGRAAFGRADILLWKKGGSDGDRKRIEARHPGIRIHEYSVVSKGLHLLGTEERQPAGAFDGKKILAVAGIARPERFFGLLEGSGIKPDIRMTFPDHYAYPPAALEKIMAAARKNQIEALITTEKDGVKFLDRLGLFTRLRIYVMAIGLDLPASFFESVRAAVAPSTRGPLQR